MDAESSTNWTDYLLAALYFISLAGFLVTFVYTGTRENGRANGIRNFGLQLLFVIGKTCKLVILPGIALTALIGLVYFIASQL